MVPRLYPRVRASPGQSVARGLRGAALVYAQAPPRNRGVVGVQIQGDASPTLRLHSPQYRFPVSLQSR